VSAYEEYKTAANPITLQTEPKYNQHKSKDYDDDLEVEIRKAMPALTPNAYDEPLPIKEV